MIQRTAGSMTSANSMATLLLSIKWIVKRLTTRAKARRVIYVCLLFLNLNFGLMLITLYLLRLLSPYRVK
jgi:hypothetical protein